MVQTTKTDAITVCVDADVIIAGLFSRTGASHAILVLGEIGLLDLVVPDAAVTEVRRNLAQKLPEATPLFDAFLRAQAVRISRPTPEDDARAQGFADSKDVPILAAALSARARLLLTHNTRHFQPIDDLRVVRPGTFIEEVRAWLSGLGR